MIFPKSDPMTSNVGNKLQNHLTMEVCQKQLFENTYV